MGEIANDIINHNISKDLPFAGTIQVRPDTSNIDKKAMKWKKAKITGVCARPMGAIIEVSRSPDAKFLYVNKKKGVGTINKKKVRILH